MEKKDPAIFVQNDISKRFIDACKRLVDNHLEDNYRAIADSIEWTESSISSVRGGRINVPIKYAKAFEKHYKISIISPIENEDVQNRLLRIEANIEVFQVAIAGLKSKRTEDFDQRFSELQTLIEEAVKRRKQT